MEKYLTIETNKNPCEFKCNEEIICKISYYEDGILSNVNDISYDINSDYGFCIKGKFEKIEGTQTISFKIDKPCHVFINVDSTDKEIAPIRSGVYVDKDNMVLYSKKPLDYDDFWESTKKELYLVEPKIISQKEIDCSIDHPNHKAYDIRLQCAGGKPVSGILTIPKVEGKYPCKVTYCGYGVKGCFYDFNDNQVIFNINAHGIDNLMPQEYYDNLTYLYRYAHDSVENKNPHTTYFKYMIVRAAQALRFVKSLPIWNGVDLIARGGSQGALQAIYATTLVDGVSLLDIYVPWLCDIGGIEAERKPYLTEEISGLLYYDTVIRARYVTCDVNLEIHMGDESAHPGGCYLLYKNLINAKSIKLKIYQNAPHTQIYSNSKVFEY